MLLKHWLAKALFFFTLLLFHFCSVLFRIESVKAGTRQEMCLKTATTSAIDIEMPGEDREEELPPELGTVALKIENKKKSILLYWKKLGDATGYLIYRAETKDGTYKRLTRISGSYYTDNEVECGQNYYYKVRAYVKWKGSNFYGEFSEVKKGKVLCPEGVKWFAGCYREESGLSLYWKKVSGADGYAIFHLTDDNTVWEEVALVSFKEVSYRDKKAGKEGGYYKIRAYRESGGVKYYGAASVILDGKNLFCKGYQTYSLDEKLEVLRVLFPDGVYWNHKNRNTNGMSANEACLVISDSPCLHEENGEKVCNIYNGKTRLAMDTIYQNNLQCLGFASMVSDFLFGKKADITKVTNYSKLQVGDHIRLGSGWDHSVVVIEKNADYIKVVECNRDYESCKVEWDRKITKSELESWDYYALSRQ